MIIRQDKEYIWVRFEKKDYGGAGRKPAEEIIAQFYMVFSDDERYFDRVVKEWQFERSPKNLKKLQAIKEHLG